MRRTLKPWRLPLVLVTTGLLGVTACTDTDTNSQPPPTVSSQMPTSEATKTTATDAPPDGVDSTAALASTDDNDLIRNMTEHGVFHTGCGGTSDRDVWNTVGMRYPLEPFDSTVTKVLTGKHECFDRIVFDVTTPKMKDEYDSTSTVGYDVSYLTDRQMKFEPLPIDSDVQVKIVVNSRTPAALQGYHFRTDWNELREVKFLGESDGQTTFAVGLTQHTAARLSTLVRDGKEYLVVDFTHP